MAQVQLDGNEDPTKNYPGGTPNFDESASAQPAAASPSPSPSSTEQQLKDRLGSLYDPSILGDVQRNTSYAGNTASDQNWIDRIVNKNLLRGTNEPNSTYVPNGTGGTTVGPTGKVNAPQPLNQNDPRVATSQAPGFFAPGVNMPGAQFNDPYSNLLEQLGQKQIASLTGQNAQMSQLMDFLNKQFSALSTSNGYTPDEMAVLRTQVLDPISQQQKAAQQRELQRTSAAGYLPTSGITLDQQRNIDTNYDQARTAAMRDLAINGINRQDQQRQQAINVGMQALQLPQQQTSQALDVANTLYQMPRQAMMDANTIINGSSPQSIISPLIQLQQQQLQQQQYNQQQQAQFAGAIGQWLSQLFG